MIAFSQLGGTQDEIPYSYCLQGQKEIAHAISIGGDLRRVEVVRALWQLTIQIIEESPVAVWLNLTRVLEADTKLAACLIAILRRARTQNTSIYIIGSNEVQNILKLCKVPPLSQFTKVA
ncbi:MAG: hypothetical protein QF718_10185 [Phycisphaerales bacterium]|nr:hypothetical protein [Phycisphaerales bacterium]